jgi:hypothetical protein
VAQIDAFVSWLSTNYAGPIFTAFAIFIIAVHFYSKKTTFPVFLLAIFFVTILLFFVILAIAPEPIAFGRFAAVLFLYGVLSFVILSTILQSGLAAWLTRKRGEQWVKELDYLYLAIGSIGVLATVNRLPFITNNIEAGDLIAPIIITTAIVIRFIKTRAEIGGWNKV